MSFGDNMNVSINVPTEELASEVSQKFQAITDKYVGGRYVKNQIIQLKYELTQLAIELYHEGKLDTFQLDDKFSDTQTWTLSDLLLHYKYVYPDRFREKESYTKIDVNNMLFDLKASGVLASYDAPLLCFETFVDGSALFDAHTFFEVGFIHLPLEILADIGTNNLRSI